MEGEPGARAARLIELGGVTKVFDDGRRRAWKSLDDITVSVGRGEFVCFVGPSGCGKSTLINLMAGFETPTSGRVAIDWETVKGPSIRRVTIFQDYGLLPWRTVRKNVELGLESMGLDQGERR